MPGADGSRLLEGRAARRQGVARRLLGTAWVALVVAAYVAAAGCGTKQASSVHTVSPGSVERNAGSDQRRVHLTGAAFNKLGIRVGLVTERVVPLRPTTPTTAPPTTLPPAPPTATPDTTPPAFVLVPVAGEADGPPVLVQVPAPTVPTVTAAPTTTVPPTTTTLPVRRVIPFAAVLYQPNGDPFTFTNPQPLVYVRQPLTIDYVVGDLAVLSNGPAAGTAVVTVGATELLGLESGVGE